MQITYLAQSGFALEKENELLVFDCYNPKKHALLKPEGLAGYKSITIFISHAHGDHFNPDIWALQNACFVAGFDVPVPKHAKEKTTVLHPSEKATVNGVSITAYGSTDEGVSFFVDWNGTSLFHAGDLNDWHWRNEADEAYAQNAEQCFLQELQCIAHHEKPPMLAFFPVDPRMGPDYYRGAILFAKEMRPKYFMPMHFGREYAPPAEFFNEIAPFTELLTPPDMGQSITVEI